MTLQKKAGQTLVVGFEGQNAPTPICDALSEDALAGVILFSRNIESAEQTKQVLTAFAKAAGKGSPPLLCVDQEGGRVQRMKAPFMELPPMRSLGNTDDVQLTEAIGNALGRQLRAVGFNLDFAPVLDVDSNPANPIIGDRSFSNEPKKVIRHGIAFAKGLGSAGVLSCGKHFPGHGDTDTDSHLALPRLRHARDRLDQIELPPFAESTHAIPSVMTAHVVFESLDPTVPATLSPKVVTQLLKEELGYKGAVFSDDLEMKAVSERWGVVDAGVLAIAAGCDLLLVCSKLDLAFELREALVLEAEKSPAFKHRLKEAAANAAALREQIPDRPSVSLSEALQDRATKSLLARLEESIASATV